MNSPDSGRPYPGTGDPLEPRQVRVSAPSNTPWLTYVIIGLSVAVFLAQMLTEARFGVDWPATLGMKVNQLILQGQYWRLITPVLLHGSVLHILFNMYALYAIGRSLEQNYGHLRYFLLYMISGFAGNVFSFLLSPANSLGSSTAIFGLFAAQGIFVYQNRDLFGAQARPVLTNIVTLMAVNLIIGLSPGIDNWGHLGGLLGGLAFAWFAGPIWHVRIGVSGYHLEDQREASRAWVTVLIEAAVIAGLVLQRLLAA